MTSDDEASILERGPSTLRDLQRNLDSEASGAGDMILTTTDYPKKIHCAD
ncbi:hypothetical protein KGM_214707 [Danaus plexippus plexippus]|uniref:Uncharacterized protein n=1 Tax=Danaus plexippus plexippus TaxID=278856 RepID=A0A212ETK8_DANPL|nr:hypothetical protein KGM_214707 [Danaus plexippus plexippus]